MTNLPVLPRAALTSIMQFIDRKLCDECIQLTEEDIDATRSALIEVLLSRAIEVEDE
ncbi:hypothetical protein ACP3V3_19825 [Vibrio sp. PNB22_3_1]